MGHDEFELILTRRLEQTRGVLGTKAREHATGGDRLHNFKRSAAILGCSPAQACVGFLTKHLTSILDMVAAGTPHPEAVIDEKIGDAVNYLILLEAILKGGADRG